MKKERHLPPQVIDAISNINPIYRTDYPRMKQYSQLKLSQGLDMILDSEQDQAIFGFTGRIDDLFYDENNQLYPEMSSFYLQMLAVIEDIKHGLFNLLAVIQNGEISLPNTIVAETSNKFLSRVFNHLPGFYVRLEIYPPDMRNGQTFNLTLSDLSDFINDIPKDLGYHVTYVWENTQPLDPDAMISLFESSIIPKLEELSNKLKN